jgi:hypothetical protein
MTQLTDMANRRTRGLDAALRAMGFVLWFSFIFFCVGLNQSHGLCCADDAWFAIIAKPARLTGWHLRASMEKYNECRSVVTAPI